MIHYSDCLDLLIHLQEVSASASQLFDDVTTWERDGLRNALGLNNGLQHSIVPRRKDVGSNQLIVCPDIEAMIYNATT